MAGNSRLQIKTLTTAFVLLLSVPFPVQFVSAGTVWSESPQEFADGEMENLDLGPEGLSLNISAMQSTGKWTNLSPPNPPKGRHGCAMDYDSRLGKVVMFGGYEYKTYWYLGDTWTYDLDTNIWTFQSPADSPPIRESSAMAYDSSSREFVLFGGFGQCIWGDIWTYDLGANTWNNPEPVARPEARGNPGMAYDSGRDRIVLFGGLNGFNSFEDTWTYDTSTNTWMNMNPSTSPQARWGHGMVYDSAHRKSILFGGKTGDEFLNDTWTYDLAANKWTLMNPQVAPSPRCELTMAFDNIRGEAVLFGGNRDVNAILSDTWTYNLTTNRWTNMTPAASPPARGECGMAYYGKNNAVVIFSGYTAQDTLDDTWKLTFYNGTAPAWGTFTSAPHDTGGQAYFGTMSWDAAIPPASKLSFQFRSADTEENLALTDFAGPDGTPSSFYQASGQALNSTNNGTRWFQYRAHFSTDDLAVTPLLRGVTIRDNLIHELTLLSPAGGENWTGLQTISWTASDKDNDTLSFDIFLDDGVNSVTLARGLPAGTSNLSWNASMFPNGTYRIRIIARDNNASIPLTVTAISGDFTIYHPPPPPPPNRPPHVILVSPLNNSVVDTTSVRLEWVGTDPDGDPLAFGFSCSVEPAPPARIFTDVSSAQSFDLAGLADNTTYFWTVSADDGKTNQTDVPVDVWSFTVKLPPVVPPPVNHPPRITSTPPANATEGELYIYNVTAADPDNDSLTFLLVNPVQGMAIDPVSGKLSWTPTSVQILSIKVAVSDGRGGFDEQTYDLTVLRYPPICSITFPAEGATVSGTINITGLAAKGFRPLQKVEVRIDGGDWTEAIQPDNWRLPLNTRTLANGLHTIQARAFDGRYYSENATVTITVDNAAPKRPRPENVSFAGNMCPLFIFIIILAIVGGIIAVYYRNRRAR